MLCPFFPMVVTMMMMMLLARQPVCANKTKKNAIKFSPPLLAGTPRLDFPESAYLNPGANNENFRDEGLNESFGLFGKLQHLG